MSATDAADGGAYWSCPRCARTWSSCYPEALQRRDAPRRATAGDAGFEEVKRRLEAWLRRLDEQDPWFVLGVRPDAPLDAIRARYRELALAHHPDRGGDPAQMRRIARAWDRIRSLHAAGRIPARPERRRIAAPAADDE